MDESPEGRSSSSPAESGRPPAGAQDPEELRSTYTEFHPSVPGETDGSRIGPVVETETHAPEALSAIDRAGRDGAALGDFLVIRELGRGGMGIVYEAEQISLKRRVALKVLAPHLTLSSDVILKFHREAEAGGRHAHPGIVSIFAVGQHQGTHYIAMELVEGGTTLADRLAGLRAADSLPAGYFRQTATLFAAVAEALAHAHDNGVVHRDIKPSNILLTKDGAPKVGDFGLAKIENALALTKTGEFEGTPYYVSPEQVTGRPEEIDHRSDIFSLGATLYEALVLVPPFRGDNSIQVLRKVVSQEAADPHAIHPRVPRDLAIICAKAMEKERSRRYPTMAELAADLHRWLSGEAIHAHPVGPLTRSLKWMRRNRRLAAAGAGALSVLFLLSGAMLCQRVQEIRAYERQMARAATAAEGQRWGEAIDAVVRALSLRPNDQTARDRHQLYLREKELAAIRSERDEKEKALGRSEGMRLVAESAQQIESNPGLALLMAVEGAQRYPALQTRNAVARALAHCRELRTIYYRRQFFHNDLQVLQSGEYRNVVFSPDGRRVLSSSWDEAPAIWDVITGERIAVLSLGPANANLRTRYGVYSRDGRKVALCGVGNLALVFDAETGSETLRIAGHRAPVQQVLFSPDGRTMATAGADSTARIWDAETGKPLAVLAGHADWVFRIAYSPDGSLLASASTDGTCRIWNVATGNQRNVLEGHPQSLRAVSFSPDGRHVATACDQELRLWDASNGTLRSVIIGGKNPMISVAEVVFSPDGSRVTTTWGEPTARIWSVPDGREVLRLRGHVATCRLIRFSPDGGRIVTAAFDNTARIWDARTGEELAVLRGHTDFLHQAVFSPDGRTVATISEDATVRIWDAETGARRDPCVTGRIERLAFDEEGMVALDGRRLSVDPGDERIAWIRPVGSPQAEPLKLVHDSRCVGGRFSPDGALVVSGSRDDFLVPVARVWSARTGELLHRLLMPSSSRDGRAGGFVVGARFLDRNRQLMATSEDGAVEIWSLPSGKGLVAYQGHERWVVTVAFSPDDQKVVTASMDRTARIWDRTNGKELAVLRGHEADLRLAAFAPDSRRVVTASADETVRAWNAETGEELLTLTDLPETSAEAIGFSPDGENVVAVSKGGATRSWPVDALAAAARQAPRSLTPEEKEAFAIWSSGEERALALVRQLFSERILAADVIAQLQGDPSLDEDVRQAALRFAGIHEDSAPLLERGAGGIRQNTASTPEKLERARRFSEAAARLRARQNTAAR